MSEYSVYEEIVSAIAEDFSLEELLTVSNDLEQLLRMIGLPRHLWSSVILGALAIKILKVDHPPNWRGLTNTH